MRDRRRQERKHTPCLDIAQRLGLTCLTLPLLQGQTASLKAMLFLATVCHHLVFLHKLPQPHIQILEALPVLWSCRSAMMSTQQQAPDSVNGAQPGAFVPTASWVFPSPRLPATVVWPCSDMTDSEEKGREVPSTGPSTNFVRPVTASLVKQLAKILTALRICTGVEPPAQPQQPQPQSQQQPQPSKGQRPKHPQQAQAQPQQQQQQAWVSCPLFHVAKDPGR